MLPWLFPSQATLDWEGCGRKDIPHKTVEMIELELLVTQMRWHPVGSSVWIPLLASLTPNKARNITGLQQVTEDLTSYVIVLQFATWHSGLVVP